ncbi:MAG: RES family NAD+ phosphorylase [Alphaproteobacteria bacterium]|nr:RES family NAD+ phosphorylase [Alphaproteobacteria bacterium]
MQCQHLHYLLSTPFRYDSTPPFGSRFRRAGQREAVFYGAERSETAIVEMAFYRLLFFAESPGLNQRGQYSEYTVFSAKVKTGSLIDLSEPPYAPYEQHWSHLSDYLPSQTLADQLRQEHVDGIRYKSVRDISGGRNLALFSCSVFVEPKPVDQQTWRLVIGTTTITAICESTRDFYEIPISQFHADPRLAVITQRT